MFCHLQELRFILLQEEQRCFTGLLRWAWRTWENRLAEAEIVTCPVVSRGQAVDSLQSLSRETKSPYLFLESPQTAVGAPREEQFVGSVYWAGFTCLFTTSIPSSQVEGIETINEIHFPEGNKHTEGVHQHCWLRPPGWFLKRFVVSKFETGSNMGSRGTSLGRLCSIQLAAFLSLCALFLWQAPGFSSEEELWNCLLAQRGKLKHQKSRAWLQLLLGF